MLFDIVHKTDYSYSQPVTEACLEARLRLPCLPSQEVLQQKLEIDPPVELDDYCDPFGNQVAFISMAQRHERLRLTLRAKVRTSPTPQPLQALATTVAEARQILTSKLSEIFEYLEPTPVVPVGGCVTAWVKKIFRAERPLGDALSEVCHSIYKKFKYQPGATENTTPFSEIWRQRKGVCQDFAHVMLSVLRTAGIPARYVCGYIESGNPAKGGLTGSLATHAWVEALVPGMVWVGFDPTNNQMSGERHVAASFGRDYSEAAPVRGTFKGAGTQKMKVKVSMRRLKEEG